MRKLNVNLVEKRVEKLLRGVFDGEEKTEVVPRLQEEASVARRRRERPRAVLQKVLSQAGVAGKPIARTEDR